jgi:hypothetical protein
MNNSISEGFKRLQKLKPNYKYEKWYFSKVLKKSDIPYISFYSDNYSFKTKKIIKSTEIIGTHHTDYHDKLWIEMLGSLKKFNVDNYSTAKKIILENNHPKSLNKFGDYIMIGEGNHRFCMAKFLGIDFYNMPIVEYEFNDKFFSKWQELKKRDITPFKIHADLWILLIFNELLRIKDEFVFDFIKKYDDTLQKSNIFGSFNQSSINVTCSNDLNNKRLRNLILKNKKMQTIKEKTFKHYKQL